MSLLVCKLQNCRIWRRVPILVVSCVLVAATDSFATNEGGIDIEALLKTYKTREAKIGGLSVQWEEDCVERMPNGTYDKYFRSWRVLLEGEKVRTEETGEPGAYATLLGQSVRYQKAFNGKVGKELADVNGDNKTHGIVDSEDPSLMLKVNNTNLNPILFALRPTVVLTSRERLRTPWISETGELDGERVYVLRRKAGLGQKETEVLYIDPASLLIKRASSSNNHSVIQWDIEYRDIDGQALPVKWKRSITERDGRLSIARTTRAVHVELNAHIVPEEFELAFPIGTFVTDRTNGQMYVIGPKGETLPFRREDMERGVTFNDIFHGRVHPQVVERGGIQTWLLYGNILLVVALCCLLVWRHVHHQIPG